jgi:hypothetical protein
MEILLDYTTRSMERSVSEESDSHLVYEEINRLFDPESSLLCSQDFAARPNLKYAHMYV